MAEVIFSAFVSDMVSRVISLVSDRFSPQQSTEAKLQRIGHMLIRVHSVVQEAKARQIRNGMRVRIAAKDGRVDEVDRVLESLQGLSGDLKGFIMLLQDCQPIRRPLPTNIFVDGQMFGRHVEKERIINFLLDGCSQSRAEFGVLPIVGRIGSGKTTLVQHVCDDARVRSSFQKMLELILPVMRCSKVGSKVIITTNNHQVATIGTVEPIILNTLPFPEYWFFFEAHAFAGRDLEENPRMVKFGKAIARKLNGSFFGAKMVGGTLRDHPNPMLWCKVLKSNIGGLSLLGDGIGYVADLAENLLPSHVDMCLVTVSMGPFSSQRDLVRLQDLFEPISSDSVSFPKVLLCKSVLPFCNYYYVANCTVGSADSFPDFTVVV
ncbi:unnamed protein product [Urochloa decumbens]|uniref:NB-ARC domain-containing protein n=1 Tax=Urochloa decumbens TaxID=240449 RepID=A0ABC9GF20_9POAL